MTAVSAGGSGQVEKADLPLRATVIRKGPDDHVLVLLLHHIVTDEWSDGPFLAAERGAGTDAIDLRDGTDDAAAGTPGSEGSPGAQEAYDAA